MLPQGPEVISFAALKPVVISPSAVGEMRSQASSFVTIRLGLTSVRVGFSEEAAAADFRYRFEELVIDYAPDHEFFVVETLEGTYFWAKEDKALLWPYLKPPPFVTSFLADNATMWHMFGLGSYLSLHAGVVAGMRGLVAIVGSSTAGKTTTIVACARRGMRLYSDERCVLKDHLVYPFLRAMTLRSGGRRLLGSDGANDGSALTRIVGENPEIPEILVRPSMLFPDRVGGPPLPLSAIVAIDGVGSRPELTNVTVFQLLPLLAESLWGAVTGLDRVACILREFGNLRSYKLQLGGPDETARLIEGIVA